MKNIIKKILKEDFDWIKDIPSFIEITEPVSQKNPKDKYRLYWTNGHGEDYATWADNWINFNNNRTGIDMLTKYVRILQNGLHHGNRIRVDIDELVDLYLSGGHDYIVNDMAKREISTIDDEDEIRDFLEWTIREDLEDMGILTYDDSTLENWKVTYFDENGIEFNTKINN